MELEIRYQNKQNGKGCIEGRSFVIELDNSETEIKSALKGIESDYAGDISDTYYFEPGAEGFSVFLKNDKSKKKIFSNGSGIREKKLEPLAFADGLIRRCRVKKLVIVDQEDNFTIINPKVSKENDQYITAGKFIHEGVDHILNPETKQLLEEPYKFVLKKVSLYFLFQDTSSRNVKNGTFYPGCAPYFFIIRGEEGCWKKISGYEYNSYWDEEKWTKELDQVNEEVTDVRYDFSHGLQMIRVGNKDVPVVTGEISFYRLKDGEQFSGCVIKGMFMGYNTRLDGEYDYSKKGHMAVLGMTPLMMGSMDAGYADCVAYCNLDRWIRERIPEINELETGFKKDICRQLNERLKEYGFCLSPGFAFLNDKEIKEGASARYQPFTLEQTETLFHWCYDRYKDGYGTDVAKIEISAAMAEYGKTRESSGELSKEKMDDLVSIILKQEGKSTENDDLYDFYYDEDGNCIMDDRSGYNTAVHEIGHALIGEIQTDDSNPDKKVTIKNNGEASGWSNIGFDYQEDLTGREKSIHMMLASHVVEEMFFGGASKGWVQDYKSAAFELVTCIAEYGEIFYSDGRFMCRLPGNRPTVRFESAIDELIAYYMKETENMLSDKEDLIRELACRLIREETINADRFNRLYHSYYERIEAKRFCDRLRLALETVKEDIWHDKESKELIGRIFPSKSGSVWTRNESEKYAESKVRTRISYILGFDLFGDDWREHLDRRFPDLSDEVVRKGKPGVIIGKDGYYAVFLDYTDRTGSGERYCYNLKQKLSYETIEYTNAVYSK